MSDDVKKKYSASAVLAKYKRGNKIVNIVFLFILISAVFIDALTPPVVLTLEIMIPKIIFIAIFSIIYAILRVVIKFMRIVLLRRVLTEECAPNKYIEILKVVLEFEHNKVYKSRCLFDMIAALIYSGEFNKALYLLQSKEINKDKLKKQDLLCYYVYSSECHYNIGNINESKRFKSMAENLMKEKKYNFAQKKSNDEAIFKLDGKFAFYNNDFKKARKLYQLILINSTSILSRIVALYNLALIDVEEKKIDCAKEKFEVVIQYGNELYQVKKSKENLKSIELFVNNTLHKI